MARQFNLIPPVCEQAEYHYFQRDKVEVQLPELYHKIGQTSSVSQLYLSLCSQFNVHFASFRCLSLIHSFRCWSNDLVSTCLWINHREVQRWCTRVLQSSNEGQFDLTGPPLGLLSLKISLSVILSPISWALLCEISTVPMLFSILLLVKGYQWLKERVNSEEGRRQLAKIKELHLLADRLGCTAAQLAIGTRHTDTCSFFRHKTIDPKCLFTKFHA